MMGVDQAGNDHMAGEIDDFVGPRRQGIARPDRCDAIVFDQQAAIADLAPVRIHGDEHIGVTGEQSPRHRFLFRRSVLMERSRFALARSALPGSTGFEPGADIRAAARHTRGAQALVGPSENSRGACLFCNNLVHDSDVYFG